VGESFGIWGEVAMMEIPRLIAILTI